MLFEHHFHRYLHLKKKLLQQKKSYDSTIHIQDIVIHNLNHKASFGEAKVGVNIHDTKEKNSFCRLIDHIRYLASLAKTLHQDKYCQKDAYNQYTTVAGNENKITRLSLNEFSLYTSQPLTLDEFGRFINKVTIIAMSLNKNIHLLLSSLAVLNSDNILMNIVLYIQGGRDVKINLIHKVTPSAVDVDYSTYELGSLIDLDNYNDLDEFEEEMAQNFTSFAAGSAKDATVQCISHNSVFELETSGGAHYIQAIDICLDHEYEQSKKLVEYMVDSRKATAHKFIPEQCDHVLTSNSIPVCANAQTSHDILHVDSSRLPTQRVEVNDKLPRLVSATVENAYDNMHARKDKFGRIFVYNPPFGSHVIITVLEERKLSQFIPKINEAVQRANDDIFSQKIEQYLSSSRNPKYLSNTLLAVDSHQSLLINMELIFEKLENYCQTSVTEMFFNSRLYDVKKAMSRRVTRAKNDMSKLANELPFTELISHIEKLRGSLNSIYNHYSTERDDTLILSLFSHWDRYVEKTQNTASLSVQSCGLASHDRS